jgi:hypothetical protein
LRLRIGQVLEVMCQEAHCFTLGFSSVAAYALERCERGARWVEGTRCLARRLESLPSIRMALARGELPWSAVELLARVATAETELRWLAVGATHTVRQLRTLVRAEEVQGRWAGSWEALAPDTAEDESTCTLTVTVDR